jgi:adenylate cyclase class 2
MPVELEVKIRVERLEEVRVRLRALRAESRGSVLETNRFFDTTNRSLYKAGKGLRLRTNRNINTNQSTHIITFKGPKSPGPLKRREEIEVTVDDPDAATSILQALDYTITLSFEKRRETWQFGACEIALDELPLLGTFVEIEGPDEASIRHVQRQLGLDGLPTITNAYSGLLMDHLKSQGRSDRVIRL